MVFFNFTRLHNSPRNPVFIPIKGRIWAPDQGIGIEEIR